MTVYITTKAKGRFKRHESTSQEFVTLTPEGGGFIFHVTNEVFGRDFCPAPEPAWRWGSFSIHHDLVLPGFTDGRLWNGWAAPYFEREEIAVLVKYFNLGGITHKFENDTLHCVESLAGGYHCGPRTIQVGEATHTVWPFGDGWCWDEVTR